ncbi:MAG: hypothetical protein DYG90_14120, partial [Chloroflexi bacterium CFX6]|nr:hypothetical protein [Chloroflexi bacterium CFX6]
MIPSGGGALLIHTGSRESRRTPRQSRVRRLKWPRHGAVTGCGERAFKHWPEPTTPLVVEERAVERRQVVARTAGA